MAIIDDLNEFADGASLVNAVGTVYSDVVDLGADGDALSRPQWLRIRIGDTAVDSSGDGASINFKLQTDDGLSGGNLETPTDLFATGAIAEASLTANSDVALVRVPVGAKRYLQVASVITGEAVTAGTYNAYLTDSVQRNDFTTSKAGQPA